MALENQVNLFKVDTNAFLSKIELSDKSRLIELRNFKRDISYKIRLLRNKKNKDEFDNFDLCSLEKKEKELKIDIKIEKKIFKDLILDSTKKAVEYNKINDNKIIRKLDNRFLEYTDKNGIKNINIKNIVSMFMSDLSRSFKIKKDELTYDIIIVETYYHDILQDLILNGFYCNDKYYIYYSSSAGQIRTKKTVFVEEKKYHDCQNKLMCGLTIDKINKKGGMNINKYLAYRALSNSATDLWFDIFKREFNIDECIVVDDFETNVSCMVDNIDYETYEITPNVLKSMPIPHTDGCGMIDESYCNKNFMVRLPFIKGLLGSFGFRRFINENNCSTKIKDIWGDEYDIIEDNIKIIFTKSQLKMYKYYDNWEQYKNNFKKYKCDACVCNIEEDKIKNARINYQMLQTLYNMTDDEIFDLCKQSNKKIKNISKSLENMLCFFGVGENNYHKNKDNFQKSIELYPELLNDISLREDLKDLKNSVVKSARGGKLEVRGKFTFVLPDLYAFCEFLFCDIKVPIGLLKKDEVFCNIYKNSKELDCLRSPSLYIEHVIGNNVCNKKYRNQRLDVWFNTNAIYINTHDLITRTLQLDVDGDKLLVLAQKSIIKIAKRHMEGVNPLYYEMKKANAKEINSNNLYGGLKLAFTGGNIGAISNDITKIWAMDKIGKDELKAIRWLCMETNFTIDYAKTLFKPIRPKEVDNLLKSYHRKKVPNFFIYAKDKEIEKVESPTNSTMNKICKEIKDNRVMFKSIKNLGKLNYLMFLRGMKHTYSNEAINKLYNNENRKYGNILSFDEDDGRKSNLNLLIEDIKNKFLEVEEDEYKIVQSLVKHLYENKTTRKKKLLWYIYGEELLNNLVNNVDKNTEVCMQCGKRVERGVLVRHKCFDCRNEEMKNLGGKKIIKCIDCGKEFEVDSMSRIIRCNDCKITHRKQKEAERLRKIREKE